MTQQFRGSQDVEVRSLKYKAPDLPPHEYWRAAKIVEFLGMGAWQVQFPDGSYGVFDVEHIRPCIPIMEQMERAYRSWPSEQFD